MGASPRRTGREQRKAATDTGIRSKQNAAEDDSYIFDIRQDQQERPMPILHVGVNLPDGNVRVAVYQDSDV
jgi:hypothetical protein